MESIPTKRAEGVEPEKKENTNELPKNFLVNVNRLQSPDTELLEGARSSLGLPLKIPTKGTKLPGSSGESTVSVTEKSTPAKPLPSREEFIAKSIRLGKFRSESENNSGIF